jgi:hypothetical protein
VQTSEEICGFAICGLIMKICGFAICGQAHIRKLRICDSGMSPRICGHSSFQMNRGVHVELLLAHRRLGYASSKDDLTAYALCLLILLAWGVLSRILLSFFVSQKTGCYC